MKFQWEGGDMPAREAVEQDYRAARRMSKVRLGALGVYFPRLSGTVCLPYGAIAWAYLRQEEITAKVCCGRANFDRFFLMVQGPEERLYRGELQSKAQGKEALERISAKNPRAKIGYCKQDADKEE